MPDGYYGKNLQYTLQLGTTHGVGLAKEIRDKYGPDIAFSCLILDTRVRTGCTFSDDLVAITVEFGNTDKGPQGFYRNVIGKLNWVLRTGMNSREAHYHPELVEPGDFPYEGAGWHRGFCGGVSGAWEESDWWLFTRYVDAYIDLRTSASQPARDLAGDKSKRQGDEKYMLTR